MSKGARNDALPTSSSELMKSESVFLADKLSRSSDTTKWAWAPELADLEKISELTPAAPYGVRERSIVQDVCGRTPQPVSRIA